MMHRALFVSLALAVCFSFGQAGIAGSYSSGTPSHLTVKKPQPKAVGKRTNFGPARLNCHPATMTWADTIRCGYDYPPWAMGGTNASRLPAFRESLFSD
jgi:hypothetical protein